MMRIKRNLFTGTVALFTIAVFQPAIAADALEEITVTAQKRQESLQDVPLTVSVTAEAQIQRDAVFDLQDLSRVTSGFELTQASAGQQNGGARLRGIGTNTAGEQLTALGSVAIVVDEVEQGVVPFPQLLDVHQVEILSGPQGTLFGTTSSAGVVNVTSVAPTMDEVGGYVSAQFSDKGTLGSEYGKTLYKAAVNLPINDHSAMRVATMRTRDEGVQYNTWLDEEDVVTFESFRVYYLNELSENVTLRLIGEQHTQDIDGTYFYGVGTPPAGETNSAASLAQWEACGVTISSNAEEYCSEKQPVQYVKNWGATAILEWDRESVSLKSITALRHKDWNKEYRLYNGQVGEQLARDMLFENVGDQFTQEFRITSAADARVPYVAGIHYFDFDGEQRPSTALPLGVNSYPVGFNVCNFQGTFCVVPPNFRRQEFTIESIAVYGDANTDLSDTVNLFGGVRYTKHDVYSAFGVNGPVTNSESITNKNWSGRIGLRFTPSDTAMYYATISRGFKGGIIEINGNPAVPPVILDPEEPLMFEVGTKLTLMDHRVVVNGAVFHVKHDGYQTRRSRFVGTELVSISENIDGLEGTGVDLEVIANVSESVTIRAGYTLNDLPYPDDYVGVDGLPLEGKQFIYAPKHKFVMSGDYTRPLGSGDWEGFISWNAVFKGETRHAEYGNDYIVYPDHWIYGGSFGARSADGHWNWTMYGRNLSGEDSPQSILPATFRGSLDGSLRYWPSPSMSRREVGIRIDYNF